ncbi:hypothetical protein LTR39_003054, partial [Cryomyces antarcticus]
VGNQPTSAYNNGVLPPPRIERSKINGSSNVQRPALPPRRSVDPIPALPPRRPSEQSTARKPSMESVSSVASGRSSLSAMSNRTNPTTISRTPSGGSSFIVKAPAYDPATLPPLPAKKPREEQDQARTLLKSTHSTSGIFPRPASVSDTRESPHSKPPPLPLRRKPALEAPNSTTSGAQANTRRSALSFGMNKTTESPPALPSNRPGGVSIPDDASPIPLSSRPDLGRLLASKPKVLPSPAGDSCLKCRDFSGTDNHAARFPRQAIPSTDLGWLAHQLTSPFPSPTDKARAIFTWLHHNIEYDTAAFFGGSIKSSTPASTIASGLAVCEGYAGLFTALASKAGLESVVVGGHGKGYGYHALAPGAPLPPFESSHAWNAVKIDDGEWKLIDCCWGAGVVNRPGMPYEKVFTPANFTKDNDEFGLTHYPSDKHHFYRTDGRATISWQEYILGENNVGEGPTMYDGYVTEHGLGERSFLPRSKHVPVSNPNEVVRFQFAKVCEHWDGERNGLGKPCVFILRINNRDGKGEGFLPFETNGFHWWCDIPAAQLGKPGQGLMLFAVTTFDGRSGRGVTVQEFKEKEGRVGMGFMGVAEWDLV